MPPIHETDLAEERWSKAEWSHYELWEKIEVRLRKKRRIWIAATLVAFTALSAVPVVREGRPRWAALRVTRQLAQEVGRLKKDAGIVGEAFRLRFRGQGSLIFDVEQLRSCKEPRGVLIRSGSLQDPAGGPVVLLDQASGAQLDLQGLSESVCYDPLHGLSVSGPVSDAGVLVGFGVVPAEDLALRRSDRAAILLLSGTSAEISYD